MTHTEHFSDPFEEEHVVERKEMDIPGKFTPYPSPEEAVWGDDIDEDFVNKLSVRDSFYYYICCIMLVDKL